MKTLSTSIFSPIAPEPIGPYSQAILNGNTLYVSGQLPINKATNSLITDSITDATRATLQNISYILAEAGMDFSNVVKCSIFLTDLSLFSQVNEVYARFVQAPFPARETIQVAALPMNSLIEISVIACK